jgi:hypothetical protein
MASRPHSTQELFERHAISTLDRMKSSDWTHADILWQWLENAGQPTATRILAHAITLCAKRGEVPPTEVGDVAIRLLVGDRSRFRVRDPARFNAAKSYVAQHPLASLREVASFAGVNHTSVRDWRKRNFDLKRNDHKARIIFARYIKYCGRFGSPFGIKTESGNLLHFFAFLPLIENALSQGRPISEADVRAHRTYKRQLARVSKYVVAHAIRFCARRRKVPPEELAKAAHRLLVRGKPRFRARDKEKLIKAASILAKRPQTSLREVGRVVGVDHTTVKMWLTQERFKKELEERQQRRAVLLYLKYCKCFGSPFATADFPKPRKVDLVTIALLLERALAEGRPISDAAALVVALQAYGVESTVRYQTPLDT